MTKLSVNINKLATLRNSRGGNNPDLLKATLDIERFGADGITVHPRPDERHIKYNDVFELKKIIKTELGSLDHQNKPGVIVKINRDDLLVACGQGSIKILELQPESRPKMKVKDYLLGSKLTEGMRFD